MGTKRGNQETISYAGIISVIVCLFFVFSCFFFCFFWYEDFFTIHFFRGEGKGSVKRKRVGGGGDGERKKTYI